VTAWTSSLGDILASPSAQPGSAKENKTRGTCGRGLQMVFDFSDPGSASLKTSRDISAWGCPTSSKTWQEWVIERRGEFSQRLKSAHRISGSGCSSWPSPVASEVRQGFQDRSRGMKGSQESLTTVVVKQHGPAVPASSSTDGSRPGLWATPIVGDSHLASSPDVAAKRLAEGKVTLSRQTTGKLNPRWVETLMGLPVGWTMPSCRSPVTIERMS